MNFVGPSIIVPISSINYFDLLLPQLQNLLLKKFNFVHEQSNCFRLRSYERHLKQLLLCVLLIFIPNISLQFPIKIDKLIFNYNQVVNFQNKVTTSNMYVYSITIDILQSPTCNIGCINGQDCTLSFSDDNF